MAELALGIHYGIPAEAYFADPGLSRSDMKHLLRSPAHYRAAKAEEHEPSSQMLLGTATHTLLLEARRGYIIGPDMDKRSAAGKAAWAEAEDVARLEGLPVLKADDAARVDGMVAAVRAHTIASGLIASCEPEVTVVWSEGGTRCKARVDGLCPDGTVIDLKTAASAEPDEFARSVLKYGYDMQEHWYRRGLAACGVDVLNWFDIVVESSPPHGVRVFRPAPDFEARGRVLCDRALAVYREALALDSWDCYPVEITELPMPRWGEIKEDDR